MFYYIRYYIKSGNFDFPDEKIENGILEAEFVGNAHLNDFMQTDNNFYLIGSSNISGFLVGNIPKKYNRIKRLRISIPFMALKSVLIDEINFVEYEDSKNDNK